MTELTIDYGDNRAVVLSYTDDILQRLKRSSGDIIAIGQMLSDVKKLLPHGSYEKWASSVLGISQQQVARFRNVAEHYPNPTLCDNYQTTALYTLSKPSTPDAAREDAASRAEGGTMITSALADRIVRDHTTPPVPQQNAHAVTPPDDDDPPAAVTLGPLDDPPSTSSVTMVEPDSTIDPPEDETLTRLILLWDSADNIERLKFMDHAGLDYREVMGR